MFSRLLSSDSGSWLIMQGPSLVVGDDGLDSWESCLFHARHLKTAAEDLGAALYPPQVQFMAAQCHHDVTMTSP
jgi:hypothetical protein